MPVLFLFGYIYTFYQAKWLQGNDIIRKYENVTVLKLRDASTAKYLNMDPKTTCKPANQVFYLKIYKTASSTLFTMLYRYAWSHNLSPAPVLRNTFPNAIRIKDVYQFPGEPQQKYDILTAHVRFDLTSVSKLIKPDAIYIASIREPLSQYKSMFQELQLYRYMPHDLKDPALEYMRNVTKYDRIIKKYIKSIQARVFGLEHTDITNQTVIDAFVRQTDKIFKFVLIYENFDESLVLLKRKLCWEVRDIVYVVLRSRDYNGKHSEYDENIQENHRHFSAADYTFYNHYSAKFQNELKNVSQDFWEELERFKIINSEASDFCERINLQLRRNVSVIYELAGNISNGDGRTKIDLDPGIWGETFEINAVDCAFMHMSTAVLTSVLPMRNHRDVCLFTKYYKHLCETLQNWSKFYQFPIDLLAHRLVYMWNY